MATVESVGDGFKRVLSDWGQLIIDTYKGTENKAATLNKIQMSEGIKSDSTPIGQYSQGWASVRKSRHKQIEHCTSRKLSKLCRRHYRQVRQRCLRTDRRKYRQIRKDKFLERARIFNKT